MDTKKLRQKILDLAIHGKLVPQDPNDEPASVLLERIRKEKEQLIKDGKIKAPKKSKSSSDTSHYPKEGPWELPEGWCWSTLGEVCRKVVDGDHNPPPSEPSPTEYLMISSKNVLNDSLDELKDVRFLSRSVFEECNKRTRLEKGDILLTTVGTLGRSCIFDGSRKIVLQRSVSVMTPMISCDYLKCFFDSGYFQRYIENNARGTAQKGFYLNLLEGTYLPLPPLNEQHLIVNKASTLLSELNRIDVEKDVLYDRIIKAKSKILDLAIHGKLVPQDPSDEPAIKLLKRINPDFKPSDNLHYETQQLFALPRGWEWCFVKKYTKKVTDYVASGSFASLKENVRYYKEPNYAVLVKIKDFANNFTEDLTYTDEHGYNFLENSRLYGGELLFSNVGSVGKIFKVPILEMRMSLAPNAIMVKFYQDDQSAWFERVFQSPFGQESLRTIASATAIMKFNKTDFGKLLIPVPPVSEQNRILKTVNDLFAQLDCIYNVK